MTELSSNCSIITLKIISLETPEIETETWLPNFLVEVQNQFHGGKVKSFNK